MLKNYIKIAIILAVVAALIAIPLFILANIAKEQMADYELKQKIGQMLIIGFRGTEIGPNSYISKTMQKLNIGGVILFDKDSPSNGTIQRNIVNYSQVKNLVADIKKYSPSPLFVAIDAEGGYVNRLKEKYGFVNIPSAKQMGKASTAQTKKQAQILGKELAELGFNLDFAPVVDVDVNPANPVIGYLERSFSTDPEKVAANASAFIDGLHENNIITAIKHFPGHGSSTADSHLGMVDVTQTYKPEELIPYERLISLGYSDIVMTAHIMNTNIDPDYPATLSPLFINNILREELGFQGVVISDDIQMGAIMDNYGFADAIVKAINAGCDMIGISNNIKEYDERAPYTAVDAIFNAVKNGQISQNRVNQSFERIEALKEKYGLTN
ncbi:MAG: beta-N-acetylhexosaminidase [Candidatus Pacebacteria bacterium]|nr:beta-N-acetylhexosaminidase [Candidatus Paceibacterota bacterium]